MTLWEVPGVAACYYVGVLVIGTSVALWGYSIFRSPSRLKPGTLVYRWLQRSTWIWVRDAWPDKPREMTPRQIKFWAAMVILSGALTALAGVLGCVSVIIPL